MTKDRGYIAAITILLTVIGIILSFAFKDNQIDAAIQAELAPIKVEVDELTPKVNANTLILGRIESKIDKNAEVLTEVQLKVARIEAKMGD